MGIFDKVRQIFGKNTVSAEPEHVEITEPSKRPENVSLSPLPESLKGMKTNESKIIIFLSCVN